MSTPNPNQNPNQARGPQRQLNIQPQQVSQLIQALKNETAMAKAAGPDTPEGQQHSAKAESIKQVLLNYQAQQKAKMAQQRAAGMSPQPQSAPVQGNVQQGAQGRPNTGMMQQGMNRGGFPPQQSGGMQQGSPQGQQMPAGANSMAGGMNMNNINSMGNNMGNMSMGSSGNTNNAGTYGNAQQGPGQGTQQRQNSGTPSLPASSITVENFNKVKARLQEYERKIQQLEGSKKNFTLPNQISQIESQITELRSNYSRYQKFAIYMKTQLMEQARQSQLGQAPGAASQTQPPNQNVTQTPQNYNMNAQQGQQIPNHPQQNATKAVSQAQAQAASQPQPPQPQQQVPAPVPASQQGAQPVSQTPAPAAAKPNERAGKSASPTAQNASGQPQPSSSASPTRVNSNMNLQNVIKQSAPSLPISSNINVRPPVPVTLKPTNTSRPTLTGGVANGIGSGLGTPAIVKLPSYEINQTGNAQIPDNGGRVLTKRKLNELIQTIGADQGDGKTVIDGDVEELLLDLADEFINSVTGFACRLAKHRKVESIDARDVQLHLEKNWNIRIPGYAMDEIKSTRKWQPTSSYQQKISGVDISKSVNDINN